VVEQVRARHPFAYHEVDVDASDDLIRDYGYRVPVVEVHGADGEEPDVFEIEVADPELDALVTAG
jgi:hypothetical protein